MKRLSLTMTCALAGLMMLLVSVPSFAGSSWSITDDVQGDATAAYKDITKLTLEDQGTNYFLTLDLAGSFPTNSLPVTFTTYFSSSSNPFTADTYNSIYTKRAIITYTDGRAGTDGSEIAINNPSLSGNQLTWSINKNDLLMSPLFSFAAMSIDLYGNTDKIGVGTTTPIPGAIWLLGSGIMGLVGLKRRNTQITSA